MKKEKHEKYERAIFGDFYNSIIDIILDDPQAIKRFGDKHRKVTHTWDTLKGIENIYGEVGLAQALVHVWLDYEL